MSPRTLCPLTLPQALTLTLTLPQALTLPLTLTLPQAPHLKP